MFIAVDWLPIDLAKVEAILLVIPDGKLGYGNPRYDFFMGFGAFPADSIVALVFSALALSKLC